MGTSMVASTDAILQTAHAKRKSRQYELEIQGILDFIDIDTSGTCDLAEFEKALRKPILRHKLAAMDLEAGDARILFELLDNGDGHLSYGELAKGVSRLRGRARSIDVALLL